MVEPEPTPKNLRKAQIQMDEELAQRLFEEEQAQFEKEQRIAKEKATKQEAKDAALIEQMEDQARMLVDLIAERKKFFTTQRAEQTRNKPPTRAQLRNKMKLYEKEQKWINDFVPLDSEMVKDSGKEDGDSQKQAESSKKRSRAEHDEESVKKQKLEDEAEREELRACLDIVPGDDIAMDFESLATKYPIINWKTHILTENILYYQIIRADGSSKNYKIFSRMLDDFDRQDMIDLYRLPSKEDEIWKNQQDYNLISWRLFDSCGVYVLLMDIGIAIHMMLENTYPLTQEMLSRMLNRRLEVDHKSEMAFELLRLRFVYCVLPNLKTNTAFFLGETLPNSFLDCVLSQDLAVFYPRLFIAFCLQENCVLSKALHRDLLPAFCLLLKTFIAFCNSDDIQEAGSDTRPPMLDRTDYKSWSQRIRLDTLRTTPEGGVLFGSERPRTYDDLNDNDKKQFDADVYNIKMLLAGSELTKEDRESQLYDKFERFKMLPGENINEYYVRFHKLVNDMRNIRMTMPNI
ncbi:hypothetical protein Tco_0424279 [Tanacetum coccineum]